MVCEEAEGVPRRWPRRCHLVLYAKDYSLGQAMGILVLYILWLPIDYVCDCRKYTCNKDRENIKC